jgi:hypothetical protein
MAPREPNVTWLGDQPATFSFITRSGEMVRNLTYVQRQRIQRTERQTIARERTEARGGPTLPILETRVPVLQMPRHLRQYTGRMPQRTGETFHSWVNRLQRRHNQPVLPGERCGRPMR